MKKIVALALSLVMALALCTVAFADLEVSETGYSVAKAKTGEVLVANVGSIVSTAASTTMKDGKLVSGVLAFNTIGDIDYVDVKAAADADYIIYKDGKVAGYAVAMNNDGKYTVEATEFTAFGTTCGTVAKAAAFDGKVYKIADDAKYYVAGDAVYAKVGNTVVGLKVATDAEVVAKNHDYKFETATANNKTVVTKVVCANNAAETFEFKTTVAEATEAFGKGNFATVTNGDLTVYVKTAAATATTNTTTSPKTFDAGIAMYVGMSLMSVAGSAVVIGKKKEF